MATSSQLSARLFQRPSTDDGAVDRAARTCELACRRLSQACLALAPLASAPPGQGRCLHAVMDCSYVAAATARLVSRFDRHDIETIRSMVEICARVSLACADSCGRDGSSSHIERCSELARDCAAACTQLLVRLEDPVVATAGPAVAGR